jgi:hypothetical protein
MARGLELASGAAGPAGTYSPAEGRVQFTAIGPHSEHMDRANIPKWLLQGFGDLWRPPGAPGLGELGCNPFSNHPRGNRVRV